LPSGRASFLCHCATAPSPAPAHLLPLWRFGLVQPQLAISPLRLCPPPPLRVISATPRSPLLTSRTPIIGSESRSTQAVGSESRPTHTIGSESRSTQGATFAQAAPAHTPSNFKAT